MSKQWENVVCKETRKIPVEEEHNVLAVYRALLDEVESTLDLNDKLNMHLVRGAYNVLNRIGHSDARPKFEKDGVVLKNAFE